MWRLLQLDDSLLKLCNGKTQLWGVTSGGDAQSLCLACCAPSNQSRYITLQCFDAFGWVTDRAYGLSSIAPTIRKGSTFGDISGLSVTLQFFRKVANTRDKKLIWCWKTRATRLEVSQGQQTWLPFKMLGMISYWCALCSIVTLSVRRTVFEIFDL